MTTITRSPGIPVGTTFTVGGGYSGATTELDARVAEAAELLAEAFNAPVTIRFNSDRRSGGAWLHTTTGHDGVDLNCEVGILWGVDSDGELYGPGLYVKKLALPDWWMPEVEYANYPRRAEDHADDLESVTVNSNTEAVTSLVEAGITYAGVVDHLATIASYRDNAIKRFESFALVKPPTDKRRAPKLPALFADSALEVGDWIVMVDCRCE